MNQVVKVVSFFSVDGILYRSLAAIYKHLCLNGLYLLFCLPVVTIPAATAALFVVARKYINKDEPPLIRTFWKGFRENFKQSSVVGGASLLAVLVWMTDLRTMSHMHSLLTIVILVVLLCAGFILFITMMHAFPVMVHLDVDIRSLLLVSLKLTFIKPMYTFLNLICIFALIYLASRVPVLYLLGFFSMLATLTYWCVNRKFVSIMSMSSDDMPSEEASVNQM